MARHAWLIGRGIVLAGLIFGAMGTGCKSGNALETAGIAPAKDRTPSKLSQDELREKLAAFYIEFVNLVESATEDAAMETHDMDLRRRLVSGRIRAVRTCRQTALQRQPMAAFLDTWSLCIQMEFYLASPEGRAVFGTAQPLVLQAARDLRKDIEELGLLFLKPEEIAKTRELLTNFARSHPFSAANDVALPSMDAKSAMPQFGWLLELPMSPFRALQGVDQTAAAVHDLTFVASSFATTARDLPRELSWQAELLLIQMRQEMMGMMLELDAQQTNTQTTIARLHNTIKDSEKTLKAAAEASAAVESTLKTYLQMVKELDALNPTPTNQPPPPPSRPFDILDYEHTAQAIGSTATNLSQLLVEVQRTVGANALTERINEAQVSTREIANHIAKLAVLVILVFFAALTVYRVITVRARKNASPKI
jgi:hypothetical protein